MFAVESIVIQIIAFLVAITIHEASHAWMAFRLGDPTGKVMGRMSLNPLVHLDPYGTILLPLVLILIRSPLVFGWAKPVQFDPYNLKNPRKDSAIISIAGPVSNFLLAILLSILIRLFSPNSFLFELISSTIVINIVLGIFNLVPIHPLDGGKIFIGLLPEKDALEADQFLRRYGTLILLFLIFPFVGGASPLFTVLSPIINFILSLLLPGNPLV